VPFKKSLGFALKNKFVSFDRFLCYKHDDKELTANDKRCHFFKGVCVNRETGRPSSQVGYVLMSLFNVGRENVMARWIMPGCWPSQGGDGINGTRPAVVCVCVVYVNNIMPADGQLNGYLLAGQQSGLHKQVVE
jgi:hypothetical protein